VVPVITRPIGSHAKRKRSKKYEEERPSSSRARMAISPAEWIADGHVTCNVMCNGCLCTVNVRLDALLQDQPPAAPECDRMTVRSNEKDVAKLLLIASVAVAELAPALAEANRIAFEGWQNLVRGQSEILQETMKTVVTSAGQEDAMKK